MTPNPIVYVIRCLHRASGGPSPEAGLYVQDLDPDAHQGRGHIKWVKTPQEAKHFPDSDAAMAYYQMQSKVYPTRTDGQPNRPLTAYTMDIEPVEVAPPKLDTTMRVHLLKQQMLARGGLFAHPEVVPKVPSLLKDLTHAVYYSTDIETMTLPDFDTDRVTDYLKLPHPIMYVEQPVQLGMSRKATGQVDMMGGKLSHLCLQEDDGSVTVALFTYAENLWSVGGYAHLRLDGQIEYGEAITMREAVREKHYQFLRTSLESLLRFLYALYTHETTVIEVAAGAPSKAAKKKAAKLGKPAPRGVPVAYKKITIHLDQPKVVTVKPKTDRGGTHASPIEHEREGHWAYRRNPDGSPKLDADGHPIKWWVKGTTVNKGKTIIREQREYFVTH